MVSLLRAIRHVLTSMLGLCLGMLAITTLPNWAAADDNVFHRNAGMVRYERKVAMGLGHVCQIGITGAVWCWGRNDYGQVGTGAIGADVVTPTKIIDGTFVALAATNAGTCALNSVGQVFCWGYTFDGEAGVGISSKIGNPPNPQWAVLKPTQVSAVALGHAVSLSAGSTHVCAVIDNGEVRCWGDNSHGQLGVGAAVTSAAAPVKVTVAPNGAALGGVAQIYLGEENTCAVAFGADEAIWCWGPNMEGQLGTGAAGGTMYSPDNSLSNFDRSKGAVVSMTTGRKTCVLQANGEVRCVGAFGTGMVLGTGSNPPTPYSLPAASPLALGAPATALSQQNYINTCARLVNGTVKCWGGDGTTFGNGQPPSANSQAVPVSAITSANGRIAEIYAGDITTCALQGLGTIVCGGTNQNGSLGAPSPLNWNAVSPAVLIISQPHVMAAGAGGTTCALHYAGWVKCWGDNSAGNVGNGAVSPNVSAPSIVSVASNTALINVVMFASGRHHACAVRTDGTVWCWGGNSYGEVTGDGVTQSAAVTYARQVPGIADAIAVAVGDYHSCVLLGAGQVKCWGRNDHGQLGAGANAVSLKPVAASLPHPAVALAAGGNVSCTLDGVQTNFPNLGPAGVKTDAYCWGQNGDAQLGNGPGNGLGGLASSTTDQAAPTPAALSAGIARAVATSGTHTCTLGIAGATSTGMYCAGRNLAGQLGTGNTTPINPQAASALVAVMPNGAFTTPIAMALADGGTCAVNGNGALPFCWGSNNGLAIGNLAAGNPALVPTMVSLPALSGSSRAIGVGENGGIALAGSVGSAYGWGINTTGNVGDGTTTPRATPVNLPAFP